MQKTISKIKYQFNNLNFEEKILCSFPLFAILGSLAINCFYIITILIFILKIIKNNFVISFEKKIIFFILFSYFIIIISFIFSNYKNLDSFIRSIFVLKFFILPLIFIYCVKNKSFFYLLGIFSAVVTIFLSLDIIFQFIFGFDFFGFKPFMENRYSGFLDEELVAGSFISYFIVFVLISLNLKFNNKKKFIFLLSLIVLYISTIIITGERLALLRVLFIFIFSMFFLRIEIWNKILAISFVTFSIVMFLLFNQSFKNRIHEALFLSGINTNYDLHQSIKKYEGKNKLTNSPWVSHWNVAYEIFQDNKLTGVGLKNFRVACKDDKYKLKNLLNNSSCTTHPHNTYMEILSELGLSGLIIFLYIIGLFIKNFLSFVKNSFNENHVILSSVIIFMLIPFLPSGSLFASYNGGIIFYFVSIYIVLLKLNEDTK